MVEMFNVRKPNGKLCAQTFSREHAERERDWQRASGVKGRISIRRINRKQARSDLLRWGLGLPRRSGCRWPPAKMQEFGERYGAGEPVESLARYFGASVAIICSKARKCGFMRRIDDPKNFEKFRGRWTAREEELINFMYDEGIGVQEIRKSIPRSPKGIEGRLRLTAPRLSTRSKGGKYIVKGRCGVSRVLETPSSVALIESYCSE